LNCSANSAATSHAGARSKTTAFNFGPPQNRSDCVCAGAVFDIESSNFYLRVKAEVEKAVSAQPFESVHIFRPSGLIGKRAELRLAEAAGVAAARAVQFALMGKLRKYRPIAAETVAAAMLAAAWEAKPGRHIYHYDDIVSLAERI